MGITALISVPVVAGAVFAGLAVCARCPSAQGRDGEEGCPQRAPGVGVAVLKSSQPLSRAAASLALSLGCFSPWLVESRLGALLVLVAMFLF